MREEHGKTGTPEWVAWRNMKRRCDSPCRSDYHRYGGRKVKVCDRWLHSFENFLADMGPRPSPGHTLDRLDNAGDYEPGNCGWRTRKEQAQHRSTTRRLTFAGHTMTVAEWSDTTRLHRDTIVSRLKAGWTVEAALTTPTRSTTPVVVRMDTELDTRPYTIIRNCRF